jgi:ribosomal protein S1
MQKHVDALRHQVELRVKDPGAQLRASPFHSAAAIETLPTESEVLIVVVTPYWYGVETEDGHRGWVHHSQLEPLP